MFQVSVITPVYNAASTVSRAVESAVGLSDVGEILLIDDAGPDNALEICRELEREFNKVRLLRHSDHHNHGPGASRNLGIDQARFPFIAFLDADDFYLPNRFEKERDILTTDKAIDGVYGATGIDYENEEARHLFHEAGYEYQEFTTLSGPVPPEELFEVLFHQHPTVTGEFTTNAITVRRSLLDRVGWFNPELRLQQDTHLWKRLAAAGRLSAGELGEPVAVRGVHGCNRMTDEAEHQKYRRLWWTSLNREFARIGISRKRWAIYRRAYAGYLIEHGSKGEATRALLHSVIDQPGIVFEQYGFFDLQALTLTNRSPVPTKLLSAKNRIVRAMRGQSEPFS